MRKILLALLVAAAPSPALAAVYKNDDRHFSLNLPDAWQADGDRSAWPPHANSSPLGIFHAPRRPMPLLVLEYQEQPKTLGQLCADLSTELNSGSAQGNFQFGQAPVPAIEAAHQRVLVDGVATDAQGHPLRLLAYYYPGSRGVVEVAFLAPPDEFATHRKAFVASADSLAFAPGFQYVPPRPFKAILGFALAVLIPVGLIVGLVLALKR